MKFRNPLANALNHGSAGDGVGHWWAQRLSAMLMVVLTAWSVYAVSVIVGGDYATIRAWLAQPVHAALASLFVLTALYHATLGLQVVIEDYVHQRAFEMFLLISIKLLAVISALVVVFSMFAIASGV